MFKKPAALFSLFSIAALLLNFFPNVVLAKTTPAAPLIIYVDADALTGANSGVSWTNAFVDLQSALAAAPAGTPEGVQIWVAEGTYKPTSGTSRAISFSLKNGVALYGGFAGSETDFSQRDWLAHTTILSGNIGDSGVAEDNSYHVVRGDNTDPTAILDGFTIRDGYNGPSWPDSAGGGMIIFDGSPILSHIIFTSNYAFLLGGGLFVETTRGTDYKSPSLSYVTFDSNTVNNFDDYVPEGRGGGMASYQCSPILSYIDFKNNTAVAAGGGFNHYVGNPIFSHVNFSGNTLLGGFGSGGGMAFSKGIGIITDATFSNNSGQNGGGLDFGDIATAMTLKRVTFSGNQAFARGGGMAVNGSTATLVDVVFNDNKAASGGGMAIFLGAVTFLFNVSFVGNISAQSPTGNDGIGGGGIYSIEGALPDMANVVFSGNQAERGGGAYFGQSSQHIQPRLVNVTFSNNTATLQGGAIFSDTNVEPVVANSILWANTAPDGPQVFLAGNTSIDISYSDIQGGWDGLHNINANPAFHMPSGTDGVNGSIDDDLRLGGVSPAIDAGSNSLVPADAVDLNGNGNTSEPLPFDRAGAPRFTAYSLPNPNGQGTPPIVDMGAYEAPAYELIFIPNVMKN